MSGRILGTVGLALAVGCAPAPPPQPPSVPARSWPVGETPREPASDPGTGDVALDFGVPQDPPPVRPSWGERAIDPAHGTLATNAVEATVLASGPQIRACGATGSAVVRIFVASDGKVASASYFRDHLTAGGACLLEVVRGLHFPPPVDGDRAELLVPFVFRAKPAP